MKGKQDQNNHTSEKGLRLDYNRHCLLGWKKYLIEPFRRAESLRDSGRIQTRRIA